MLQGKTAMEDHIVKVDPQVPGVLGGEGELEAVRIITLRGRAGAEVVVGDRVVFVIFVVVGDAHPGKPRFTGFRFLHLSPGEYGMGDKAGGIEGGHLHPVELFVEGDGVGDDGGVACSAGGRRGGG